MTDAKGFVSRAVCAAQVAAYPMVAYPMVRQVVDIAAMANALAKGIETACAGRAPFSFGARPENRDDPPVLIELRDTEWAACVSPISIPPLSLQLNYLFVDLKMNAPSPTKDNAMTKFQSDIQDRTQAMGADTKLQTSALAFLQSSAVAEYSYNFHWMGRPIIQYPQDIVAMQELIWDVKPDLIIETGIAHGGSLIFSASLLAMLDMTEAMEAGQTFDPSRSARKVLGVDIDIREHNRAAIDAHPMRSRIEMIQGSSIDSEVVAQVRNFAADYKKILICLDSNHTHDHVLEELKAYADLTSVGSYCVVFDTLIEDMEEDAYPNRPWGKGDNPQTAVRAFLQDESRFEIDASVHERLLITVAKNGYLRRVR